MAACQWLREGDSWREVFECQRLARWRVSFSSGLRRGQSLRFCGACLGGLRRTKVQDDCTVERLAA